MSRHTAYVNITEDGRTIIDVPVRHTKRGTMISSKVHFSIIELFEHMDKEGLKEIKYREIEYREIELKEDD